MKIGIAGAGALGCHYGSRLQLAGHQVAYLARGEHLRMMREQGLRHISDGGEQHFDVLATDDATVLVDAEVLLLTGKMTDFDVLLQTIQPHVRCDALLLTLQNGVAAPDVAQRVFPAHSIAAGTAFIGARIESPGVVVHSAAGGIRAGWWQHGPGDVFFESLLTALKDAGVPAREDADARQMLWRKLLWNVGFNALTAITRRYARDMAAGGATLSLVRRAMSEAVAVAQAEGIALSEGDIDRHIEVTLAMGPVKTSMRQDIERDRPTEVDFMNGFIVRRGAERAVPTPVNAMLTTLVQAIEGSG